MSLLSRLIAASTVLDDLPEAIDFDGTNDYLSRASDLVGNADGKTFTFSVWVYCDGLNGSFYGNGFVALAVDSSGRFYGNMFAGDSSGDAINFTTPAGSVPLNRWAHIVVSADASNSANRAVYISDAAVTVTWSAYNNKSIGFSRPAHGVAANQVGSGNFKGRLAHVYLDYTYRDLSVEANRRLFITEDLKPAAGQESLNPIMYLPLTDPEDPGFNAGTGGDFTLNGVVARSGRGPNQYNPAAITLDGSSKYLNRTGVTGISDSKQVTCSFSFTRKELLARVINGTVSGAAQPSFILQDGGTGSLHVTFKNSAGSNVLVVSMPAGSIIEGKRHHVDLSFDLTDVDKRHLLLDGVSAVSSWATYVDDTPKLSGLIYEVGALITPTSIGNDYFNGVMSNLYFDTSYIDLSADNPFYDTVTGKAKDLGVDGSGPTGSPPLIYLPLRGDNAGFNAGTGGDFTAVSGPFTGARGSSEFWAGSAEFDTNGDSLSRTSTIVGAANSKTFSAVFAFSRTATSGLKSTYTMTNPAQSQFRGVTALINNLQLEIEGYNASGTKILDAHVPSAITSANKFITVQVSIDMSDTAKRHIAIDGIPVSPTWNTYTNDFIGLDSSDTAIWLGSNQGSTVVLAGSLGFLWFNTEDADFGQEANRLKFVDAFGYPVDIGEDGSIPTGNQPLIYMPFDDSSDLGYNAGTGGHFTVNGGVTPGPDVKG